MGNTIEQWRASIGYWTRGHVLQHDGNSKATPSPLWYLLSVVLVLLVIGGVELNPGPVQTYKRTKGFCGIEGPNYEIKMSALLFLRALRKREKFHIASNMAAGGKFDDVVLKLGDSVYFLQLKHKQNSQTILKLHHFVHEKDFKLTIYLESLHKIKKRWETDDDLKECGKFENAKFVIFTNIGVDEGLVNDADAADLNILNTGGKLVSLTELYDNLPRYKAILSSAVTSGNVTNSPELWEVVHKLYNKQAQDLPCEKQLQEMLKNLECLEHLNFCHEIIPQLFFCTQQLAETNLDDLIKQEIHSATLLDQLLKAVTNWWRTSNKYLTADWKDWIEMFKLHTASVIQPNPQIHVKFKPEHCVDITEKLTCGKRMLLIKSNSTNLSIVKVLQAFENNTLLIDASTLQESVDKVVTIWRLGFCDVLIVKGCTTDVIALKDKLASLHESKCLVVISDSHQVEGQFVTMCDTFCFSQLEAESQRQVLECQVEFQGYTVSLNSLADVSFMQTHLSADVVEQLYYTLRVGQKLQEVDPSYLQRTFLRNDVVNKQIFGEEYITLAITGVHQDRLAELVPPGEQIQKFKRNNFMANKNCRFWLIEGEAEFTDLCTKKDNIHWVESCEQGFRWIHSKGDISNLRKHFKQESKRNADSIVGLPQQVVLVVAEPGMGKSTEMDNIAHVVKRNDPSTWVVRVNLNEWSTLITSQITAVEFLQQVGSLKTEFEKHLLEHQLLFDGKVVVLVDGFDEISPNYTEQVFGLLSKFSKYKIKKILVTSRPVMKEKLEQNLPSLAFTFCGFNYKDQTHFLSKYWDDNPKITEFIKVLLQRVRETLSDNWNEFLGIPLQCRMLADVFHDDANHFCSTGEVRVPPSLNVLLLYEKFVKKKLSVYCEKLYGNVNTGMLQMEMEDKNTKLQQIHMNCAMFSYFVDDNIKLLYSLKSVMEGNEKFVKKFNRGKNKFGIVTHIVCNKAVFVHRTFAEYFVAMWVSQNFQTESNLTKQIYFDENFEVIQKFLDSMLSKGHELHTAVINVDFQKVLEKIADVNERDRGGRTALHLAIMNFKESGFSCLRENCVVEIKCRIIETLLEHGADVNCEEDKVLHCRPLRLAEEIKAWYAVDTLLANQADEADMTWIRNNIKKRVTHRQSFSVSERSDSQINRHNSILSDYKCCIESRPEIENVQSEGVEYCMSDPLHEVMYTALQEGYVNLVKFILNCGVSIHYKLPFTFDIMLHIAVDCKQLEIVQLLLERGSDVDICDMYGRTPLMHAAAFDHVKIAELLVKHGADVNTRDVRGYTALSFAVEKEEHEMMGFLLPLTSSNASDIDLVIYAAGNGNVEAAQILIRNKIIDSQDKHGYTALLLAVNKGKCMVELLLDHGADVDVSDKNNNTPLMQAVRCGDVKIVELLVQHGASVNKRDKRNRTALLLAARKGIHDMVKLLLDHGADVDISDENDNTPLIQAVERGYVNIAELLVQHGASLNKRDKHGRTALLLASDKGKPDMVGLLLDYRAEVDITDNKHRTPLMQAAEHGSVKLAELLVQYGACVNARDEYCNTALSLAAECVKHEMVDFLLPLTSFNASDIYSVICAAGCGDVEAVQILITNAIINSQDNHGNTALLIAAGLGKRDMVELLLQHGADVNISGKDNRTPIIQAAKYGHVQIVEPLLKHGASLNERDNADNTSLLLASSLGKYNVVELLLQHGADANVSGKYNITPLIYAVQNSHVQIVKLLVQHGASVNARDIGGNTALWWASRFNRGDIVQFLLKHGAVK